MENTLTFVDRNKQITFSDLDKDNEIEIMIDFGDDDERYFWLNKENVMSLRKHLDYVISKI